MIFRLRNYWLVFAFKILLSIAVSGCGSTSSSGAFSTATSSSLDGIATNLVFVVTPDLSNNNGDINTDTANLTNQGLQRAIKLAGWLRNFLLRSADPRASMRWSLLPTCRLPGTIPIWCRLRQLNNMHC